MAATQSPLPGHWQVEIVQPQEVKGVTHPVSYTKNTWLWYERPTMQDAVVGSASRTNLHLRQDMGFNEGYGLQLYRDEVATACTEHVPRRDEFYHPANQDTRAVHQEPQAAFLSRTLGFSLVLIIFDVASHPERDQPGQATIRTRWSLGEDCELLPPVYVGFGNRRWFTMELRDPAGYSVWSPRSYDWEAMAATLQREYDFPLTAHGLIQVAVRLQRMARMGCELAHLDTGALLTKYAKCLLKGEHEIGFLLEMSGSDKESPADIISLGWITNAIASSNSIPARRAARKLDEALALFLYDDTFASATFLTAMAELRIDLFPFVCEPPAISDGQYASKGVEKEEELVIEQQQTQDETSPVTAQGDSTAAEQHGQAAQEWLHSRFEEQWQALRDITTAAQSLTEEQEHLVTEMKSLAPHQCMLQRNRVTKIEEELREKREENAAIINEILACDDTPEDIRELIERMSV